MSTSVAGAANDGQNHLGNHAPARSSAERSPARAPSVTAGPASVIASDAGEDLLVGAFPEALDARRELEDPVALREVLLGDDRRREVLGDDLAPDERLGRDALHRLLVAGVRRVFRRRVLRVEDEVYE